MEREKIELKRAKLIELIGSQHEDIKFFDELAQQSISTVILNGLLNKMLAMNTKGIKHIHYYLESIKNSDFISYKVMETNACGYLKIFANIPQAFNELPRIISVMVEA